MKQTIGRLLVEAALIVFSVLLAFWIDDRSSAAEDSTLRAELLHRMYFDIEADSLHFSNYLADRSGVRTSLLTLTEYVSAGKIRDDSLAALLQKVEWFKRYQTNNSTYSSIINSGQLRLFERDTLFMNISAYYSNNQSMIAMTDAYMKGSNEYLEPYLNKYFDRRLYYKSTTRTSNIDLTHFTCSEFINILYNLQERLLSDGGLVAHHSDQAVLLGQIRKSF